MRIGGLSVLASSLGLGVMYYEYKQPPIQFKKDSQGNVFIPANTKAEDLFVDPARGDFRLKAENPAIGAGIPLPGIVDFDINGNPRDPSQPSIGATEFQGTPNTSGGSATKFFSAPFTYFVLFSTLLTNVVSLYLSSKILRQSAQGQLAMLAAVQAALGRGKQRRRAMRHLPPALPAQEMLEELKQQQKGKG